jgi:hypothetical protein
MTVKRATLFRAMFGALLLLFTIPALADPHCWCQIRVGGCDGDKFSFGGWNEALCDFNQNNPTGPACPWGQLDTQKNQHCQGLCAQRAQALVGNTDLAQAVCNQLGVGSHHLVASSHVGAGTGANRCRDSLALGVVQCKKCGCSCPRQGCSCPEGYTLQGDKCAGRCIPTATQACGVPFGVTGLSVIDGEKVLFDAQCEKSYRLQCDKCFGSCVPSGSVPGLGISGGQIVFDAACTLDASWQ